MKKIISVFLCILLISQTSAAYEIKTEVESANYLAWKWIIVDQSLNTELYNLDQNIQRQAVIKIVMKLSWRDVPDVCRGEFSDVDTTTWPCKYIEAALDAGYIAANDTFRPFDNITVTEAMKLVLKAKSVEKIQNTTAWQEDYMLTAYQYGIIEEKYFDYNAPATRGWIFQIATAVIEQEEEIKSEQNTKLISDEVL